MLRQSVPDGTYRHRNKSTNQSLGQYVEAGDLAARHVMEFKNRQTL